MFTLFKRLGSNGVTTQLLPPNFVAFAFGHEKGVVDGIGGKTENTGCQQVLSEMKNVVVENGLDFLEA